MPDAILWQFPNDLLLLPNLAQIQTQILGRSFGRVLTQMIFDAQNFSAGFLTLNSIWRRGTMGDF